MKYAQALVAVLALSALDLEQRNASAADARSEPTLQSIQDAWLRWQIAESRADASALEKLLTPDYVGVSWHESAQDRAAAIAAARKRKDAAIPMPTLIAEDIQMYGRSASVHRLVADRSTGQSQRILSTADFVYSDGRWQIFYSQLTPIGAEVADAAVLAKENGGSETPSASQACAWPELTSDTGAYFKALRHQWLVAELHGDPHYMDCLLAPNYRDVSLSGSSRGRDALIDIAKKGDPGKPLPTGVDVPETVQLHGDIAVVHNRWSGSFKGKETTMWAADTFARERGQWRAIYSQHTVVRE